MIVPERPAEFTSCIKQSAQQIPSLAKTSDEDLQTDCDQVFTRSTARS